MRKDPIRLTIQLVVYVALYFVTAWLFGPLMLWMGGYLVGTVGAGLVSAIAANWLTLRIYEDRHITDLGLHLNRASWRNLGWGLLGGVGAACLVLVPPIALGSAHLTPTPSEPTSVGTIFFIGALLCAGAAGEELFFRGYGFQRLVQVVGPFATIIPVGIVFALLHQFNPNANWFGLSNTAGFGILFGYAYLRSRDLWLPIGLHYGWNVTLPLFGVNLSGLRIHVTGIEMSWSAGTLWSGGDYGPEASVLTTAVLVLLFVYVWRMPICRQPSPLTDRPAESAAPGEDPAVPHPASEVEKE